MTMEKATNTTLKLRKQIAKKLERVQGKSDRTCHLEDAECYGRQMGTLQAWDELLTEMNQPQLLAHITERLKGI